MSVPSDGTRRVQWRAGNAGTVGTGTEKTDATPTLKPRQKDSTSASAAGPSFYPFDKDLIVTEPEPYPVTYQEFQKRLQDRL